MKHFIFDERLQMYLPNLLIDWEQYSIEEQQAIITEWELIRSRIPERIKALENIINQKQVLLVQLKVKILQNKYPLIVQN